MKQKAALLISGLFHPVFVNLISLLLLLYCSPYLRFTLRDEAKLFYVLFIFISTGIIPIAIVILLSWMGRVQSILLDVQHERNLPYLITACLYLIDYYFFSQANTPVLIKAYLLACASIVIAVAVINHFYKISIHAASLGALLGMLIAISPNAVIDIRWLLAIAVIASGVTLSSRLYLKAHTHGQVYTGLLLGIILFWVIL